jgi:Mrp family chromosome partitioning ATPase
VPAHQEAHWSSELLQEVTLGTDVLREEFAAFLDGGNNGSDVVNKRVHTDYIAPVTRDSNGLFQYAPAVWQKPLPEGFRLLALNVQHFLQRSSKRTVLVMSPFAGDGRSWTAASLARALADQHPPVTLLDADVMGSGFGELARPAGKLPIERNGSKSSNGRPSAAPHDILTDSDFSNGSPRLWLMQPDRSRIGEPADFVSAVNRVLHDSHDEGRSVIVDTPACTTSSIGFSLAINAVGVIYVARSRAKGSLSVHRDVRAQLDLLGATVIGIVLNEF